MKAAANVFSEETRHLLRVIAEEHPQSIAELEQLTRRKASNLSRTLRKLEHYGLVQLVEGRAGKGRRPIKPELLVDSIHVSMMLV